MAIHSQRTFLCGCLICKSKLCRIVALIIDISLNQMAVLANRDDLQHTIKLRTKWAMKPVHGRAWSCDSRYL